MNIENTIIIGSGVAGYTAALYSARANLKPLLIEGITPGGQLTITTDVENYPGFPDGILGPELVTLFKKQCERFGTRTIQSEVIEVDFNKEPFSCTTENGTKYYGKSIIISTGATAKLLGLESENALMGKGVSACATCDGFFFRDQEVAVVGGGDTAMEEALFLTKFASKVTVIHRRDQLRASKIMEQRAKENKKINFIWNSVIEEIFDQTANTVTGITVKNLITQKTSTIKLQGVFIAIGHQPNTNLFTNKINLNDQGYTITKEVTATNIPGIFACGDVQDWIYRQAVTAAGSGCMAAIDVERYLSEK